MEPAAGVVQPRAYWYAVSLVVLAAGIGLGGWQVRRSADLIQKPLTVRPPGLVQFDRAGTYSLYVTRGASKRMDAAADRAWGRARTANVSIRDDRTGASLANRTVYETVDLQNTLIARLVEFEVPAPGTYRVEITPPLDEIKPFIRPSAPVANIGNEVMSMVVGVCVGLGIGVVATIVAAAMFWIVLRRRKHFMRERAVLSSEHAGT